MKTYHSKIGQELVIPLAIILGGIGTLFIAAGIWSGVAVIALISIFAGHMMITTCYTLDGTTLRIQCGLLFDRSIDIMSITSVKPLRNAMSAPAASLDRMEIRYNALESVLVSPKEKIGFLTDLKRINPQIHISVPGSK